jgi:hypothetical protein
VTIRRSTWAGALSVVVLLAGAAPAMPAEGRARPAVAVPPQDVTQELRLEDGSRLYGHVRSVDGDRFVFETLAGRSMELGVSEVAELRQVRGRVVSGEFRPADPNATRLFFAPTARSVKKGQGYLGVFEFVIPFIQVGVTDWLSVGGGTPLYVDLGEDLGERPFWVTPKIQLHGGRNTQVAAGVFHAFTTSGDGSVGLAYGVVTQGNADDAVTVGLGFGYVRGDSGDLGTDAVLMLGGEKRIGRHLKLITENYVFSGGGVVSGGVRFFGDRLSADLGLFAPLGDSDLLLLPIVNFTWTF